MYHILVVDDEPSVSRALTMLLTYDGHEVQAVDCAEAALVLLEERDFDLIITDYFLGGKRGDQLAASIRQRRTDQPIIMVTAYPPDPTNFATLNVNCIVEKPFTLPEIRQAIRQVMTPEDSNPLPPPPSDSSPPRSFL